jgi:enoyl-CoA hydratase/carnithine racemase
VTPGLVVDRHHGIPVVRLDRGEKRNALTRDMLRALPGCLADAAGGDARAVVLTGGPDTFCAGVDVGEIGRRSDDAEVDDDIAAAALAIRGLAVPVIAAIEGPCMGAAVELAVAADIRVVSRAAFFGLPAVRMGILYRPDGIAGIVATVGPETATRLLVLGERISGADAVAAGLASHLTGPGDTLARALELAAEVAGPQEAIAATKAVIARATASGSDLSDFDAVRGRLLDSDQRQRAVAEVQAHLGATPYLR